MLQLCVLQAVEIIEHNLVEEEPGSQHAEEKNERSKKNEEKWKQMQGKFGKSYQWKILMLTVWKGQKGFNEEPEVILT